MSADLAHHMEAVARLLLGDPNAHLSKPQQLRYGTNGSLSIDLRKGIFYDHEANQGGGVLDLINRVRGTAKGDAVAWLREQGFVAGVSAGERKFIEARHRYTDEGGNLLFEVVRYGYRDQDGQPVLTKDGKRKKSFRQRQPASPGWAWNLKGVRQVPYRLPQLLEAIRDDRTIFIPEGEACVDLLNAAGLAASCNAGGARRWRDELTPHFAGVKVVILPDNDTSSRDHGALVAEKLKQTAGSLIILDIPDLPHKGDVADWFEAGHTAEDLQELVATHGRLPAEAPPQATGDGLPPAFSDEALALSFAERHAGDLRYVDPWGKWFDWSGTHWRIDDTQQAVCKARAICREAAVRCTNPRVARAIASAKTVGAVERLAKSDRRLVATVDAWDTDPWLIGTPGGTVDLQTGVLGPANPVDNISKITAVSPASSPDCPLFIGFLNEATGGDAALMQFLQQWCGYCLTGSIREHALVFIYGDGKNGKTTFANVISGVLGDYAVTAPMDAFVASNHDKHPTELAMLRGARLATASETEEGRAWAESRIKQLTGGDRIAARFMRQDFFTFTPTFKLLIFGNHQPVLRIVDDAARRRFNIIPFNRKPAKPDLLLEEKLRAEWPGILRWMIIGCLDWQRNGLVRPACVLDATEAYFSDQDLFGQ
jgi:putative DNA primase/helicase